MLSYLHEYHAGNHADVLKHAVVARLLDALLVKPTPIVYLDSHAGAGVYDLCGEQARKTGESGQGIGRLWKAQNAFPELNSYFSAVAALNPEGGCARYPGSPQLARHLLRTDDRLILMELHQTQLQRLRGALAGDRRIAIHHRDAYEGLPALLPPRPPRGLVLIDPPYEVKSDYSRIAACLTAARTRWPSGIYAVWFPRLGVQRDQADRLLHRIAREVPALLVAELWIRPQTDDFGMHGSGMALINPPWRFDEQMRALLPRLAQILAPAQADRGSDADSPLWRVEWLKTDQTQKSAASGRPAATGTSRSVKTTTQCGPHPRPQGPSRG